MGRNVHLNRKNWSITRNEKTEVIHKSRRAKKKKKIDAPKPFSMIYLL